MPRNKPEEITHAVFPRRSANFLFRALLSRPWRESTFKKVMLKLNERLQSVSQSIASAVIVRFRNTKTLALHYRISTVLSKLTAKYSFREES